MSALSNYGEEQALAALLALVSGTYFISLHTGDPGETGAANEVSGDGYARVSDTFTRTGSTAENDSDGEFAAVSADKGTVTHFGLWSAVSGGNCHFKAALTTPRAWPSGVLEFAAGDFTASLD